MNELITEHFGEILVQSVAITTLIISSVSGGVYAVWKHYLATRVQKLEQQKYADKQNYVSYFNNVVNIFNAMSEAIHNTDCTRVILLKTTNNGGEPTIEGDKFSSVICEQYTDTSNELKSVMDSWQQQKIDSVYVYNMCKMTVAPDGIVNIPFDDWKGSNVEAVYQADGIQFTKLAEIGKNSKCYVYLSMVFTKPIKELRPEEQVICRSVINKIRNIVKDSKGF